MSDQAPTEQSGVLDKLGDQLLEFTGAYGTYKQAQLSAKTKLALAKAGFGSSGAAAAPSSSFALGPYVPWIAGGLLVIGVLLALRR
jgi:hypothetical protein